MDFESSNSGIFPDEPNEVDRTPSGLVFRDEAVMDLHRLASDQLRQELEQRVTASPRKKVMPYVHGFNEAFETAAFTTAE